MNLLATRRLHDLAEAEWLYAAAREYLDAVAGIFNQPLDEVCTLRSSIFLAACQDASKPQGDQLIQRPKRVGGDIESAMEDSLPITDEFPDASTPFFVDAAVGIQYPEHHPLGALLGSKRGIAFHDRHFRLRVAESSSARSNHNHDGDL
jgi:hypothetical protein